MGNLDTVRKWFGIQSEKFATYHMSKSEYTDYLIQRTEAKGNEHVKITLINRRSRVSDYGK